MLLGFEVLLIHAAWGAGRGGAGLGGLLIHIFWGEMRVRVSGGGTLFMPGTKERPQTTGLAFGTK